MLCSTEKMYKSDSLPLLVEVYIVELVRFAPLKPGSHCAITNRDSSFDVQIGPFSSATISNMFDIVLILSLDDRNFKVIASYRVM